MEKFALLPCSLVFCGVMFLIAGFARLLHVGTAQHKGEAITWGTVGIVMGLLFLAGAVVVIVWEPKAPRY